MSLSSHQSRTLPGWPATLLASLHGRHDDATALAQVAQAVDRERRKASRPEELRVDRVTPLSQEEPSEDDPALFRLEVTRRPGRHGLRNWQGANLRCELSDSSQPWTGEVVDADLGRGRLVVLADPEQPPRPGPVLAWPMDYLRALQALVDQPALAGARPAFGRLLGAACGALQPRAPLTALHAARGAHAHPAWTWPWALVWGPPGTGKTHTLVTEVARILQDPGERVLVVSTTNQATDEVALRLGRQPGGVLRVGSLRVGPYRDRGLLDLLPRPESRLDRIQALEARLADATDARSRAAAQVALTRARRGLPALRHLLAETAPRCVLTTAHGALSALGSEELSPFIEHGRAPFTTVVIDEAGLVSRATAAGLALLAARQVVLVGDPRQLSPICIAARTMAPPVKRWLALSAMEQADLGQPATQALMRQHRMHPDISQVVSLFQYEGRLQDAYEVRGRPLPDAMSGRLAAWPRAAWIVLERCAGHALGTVEAERGARRSWQRPAGLDLFGRLLDRYPELGRLDGLFLSPYRAQADAAGRLLKERGLSTRWSASTVHAQQGSERDVVVFDLERHGGWPLPEWKRLVNVALSRARHQLLVLAAGPELEDQPGCGGLVETLVRCSLGPDGALRKEGERDAQQDLLASLSTTIDHAGVTASPAARREAPTADPADLGTQIFHSRASRRSLTLAQAQLVRREFRDLGPRVVRGVAGSGKTIVLARWAALELHRHTDRRATVVFGNSALRRHLERLIEQAWRVTADDSRAEPPWERIDLLHIGALLGTLRAEVGLPSPERGSPAEYAYEEQARALLGCALAPRFGLLYLDEAQDLGHDTLALLLSLVEPARNPELPGRPHLPARIFYDNAQNVYRRTTPRWSEFGLDVRGRSVVLRESFRTTRPCMELALDVVHRLRGLDDDPDMRELIAAGQLVEEDGRWRADFCVVQGQAPEVCLHSSTEGEERALVRTVQSWLSQGVQARDVRVLTPHRRRCERLAAALCAAGIDAVSQRNTSFDNGDPRVVVTTPQSFKGHEAELVAVVGVEGFVTRAEGAVLVETLYVALTRARTGMWVSGVRQPEGELGARVIAAVEAAARTD